ncbi:CU044_5270 family protein [Catelliglobosispora koreensis]|uniref:CU044_5270 family protein n=1 Tax=Catelliglobosispora koreensis TaxID=129052 RepID=UPI0003794C75|nr:CU044_5270 family protein [Catelliglobosispora koreensis]
MFGEKRTRTLLGPADPAAGTAVLAPRRNAHDLIVEAESRGGPAKRRIPRHTRRLVLTAGVVVLSATATAVALGPEKYPPGKGNVIVPIAYQFEENAPPAASFLLELAGRLTNAPYDGKPGIYAYHETRTWGDPTIVDASNRYFIGHGSESKIWEAPDGTGIQISVRQQPEFPDEESRDYWAAVSGPEHIPTDPITTRLYPHAVPPLPASRAGLEEFLNVSEGPGHVANSVFKAYDKYAIDRPVRTEILRILAGTNGFLWRGEVTDRSGRDGVAITIDDPGNDQQQLLIFDTQTGELLAYEIVNLKPKRVSTYFVIGKTDRVNSLPATTPVNPDTTPSP